MVHGVVHGVVPGIVAWVAWGGGGGVVWIGEVGPGHWGLVLVSSLGFQFTVGAMISVLQFIET